MSYYNYWCSRVHGLTREDTDDAPVFPEVWKQIEPLIEGLPLVAHNKPFDESCLKAVFRVYQMTTPIMSSMIPYACHAVCSDICPTISYRQWLPLADLT